MINGYRIKHIFNFMLKGSKPHRGKVNLAKVAVLEGPDSEQKIVMLCPDGRLEDKQTNPMAYLRSQLPGASSGG